MLLLIDRDYDRLIDYIVFGMIQQEYNMYLKSIVYKKILNKIGDVRGTLLPILPAYIYDNIGHIQSTIINLFLLFFNEPMHAAFICTYF